MPHNPDRFKSFEEVFDSLINDSIDEAERRASEQLKPTVDNNSKRQLVKAADELMHPDTIVRDITIRTDQ